MLPFRVTATQPTHDVRTTLLRHRFSVLTPFQRSYNVVLTSCASLVTLNDLKNEMRTHFKIEKQKLRNFNPPKLFTKYNEEV